jgi:transmembrane sensor
VEENGSATTVYVLHGAAYFASTRQPRNGVVLKEKMGAILSDGCDVPKQTFHRMANSASWATHEFHFDNTPLPEVLRDLSAYYHIRLLAPPTTQRLTGDFKADNLTEILDMIGQILNVKITIDSKHPDKVR